MRLVRKSIALGIRITNSGSCSVFNFLCLLGSPCAISLYLVSELEDNYLPIAECYAGRGAGGERGVLISKLIYRPTMLHF